MAQFSLRILLLLVTVCAVGLGFWANRARQQRNLTNLIYLLGGEVHYNSHFSNDSDRTLSPRTSSFIHQPSLPGPAWLRNAIGNEYFVTVAEAFFDKASHVEFNDEKLTEYVDKLKEGNLPTPRGLFLDGLTITDSGIEQLAQLPELECLYIARCPQVTDAGIEHLKKLKRLRRLQLVDISLTNSGLEHLAELSELQELYIGRTSITDSGLKHLGELTQLQMLIFFFTDVTGAGVADLEKELSNTEIWY